MFLLSAALREYLTLRQVRVMGTIEEDDIKLDYPNVKLQQVFVISHDGNCVEVNLAPSNPTLGTWGAQRLNKPS